MIPNILSIAGSDPSGGAGIQADIKTISANGGYAMAALTGLTAQNTRGVRGVELVSPGMVRAQIDAVREDVRIDAVKIGMLGSAEIVEAVVESLAGIAAPIVVDPVMVAKSGDRLLAAEAVAAVRERLLPIARVVTPNLPEAADLLGLSEASDTAGMEIQAAALLRFGPGAVLLKGGHLPVGESPDLLADPGGLQWLDGPRYPVPNPHGTGCTLSAALATGLGRGLTLRDAARAAKAYTAAAITSAGALSVGGGNSPTHHFHAFAFKEN